ncbi:MAG: hypothetical protein ACO1OB_20075 [Archangium sp.]
MHLALVVTWLVSAAPETWEFDGLTAKVQAKGATKDRLSAAALSRLGLRLEGAGSLKVSAHANTVGGITLHLEDPNDAKASCDLYATRDGDDLRFSDSRCSFPAFSGQLRTTATCRKISGTAKRVKDGVELTASAPDCNASPMGLPLSMSGSVSPR